MIFFSIAINFSDRLNPNPSIDLAPAYCIFDCATHHIDYQTEWQKYCDAWSSRCLSINFGASIITYMGWLRLVGSLKLYVFFAKETYKRNDILQKRPMILRSLLIVANPHKTNHKCVLCMRVYKHIYLMCLYTRIHAHIYTHPHTHTHT